MSPDRRAESQYYTVEVDQERCSLCEFCAKHCPTDAIRVERSKTELRLFFTPNRCPGCESEQTCEAVCPEQAIRLVPAGEAAALSEVVLLAYGDLVTCSNCKDAFAPLRKLDTLTRRSQTKGQTKHQIIRDLCPVCRRLHLVVRFIEDTRSPGSKAEYRSTTEILRKAGYHDLAKVTEDGGK